MRAYSMVVDDREPFADQALRLIGSMTQVVGIDPATVYVHLIGVLDTERLDALERSGVNLRSASRDHRSPYCNKLRQLEPMSHVDAEDVVLLDCDTVMRRALPRDLGAVLAKPVDFARPPLPSMRTLLLEAQLRWRPWVADLTDEPTVEGNANGGVYIVPRDHLVLLAEAWPRWADWCFDHLEPIADYAMHVDQVAFALACADTGVPVRALDRSYNFPTHVSTPVHLDRDPALLHYHRAVSSDGGLLTDCLPPRAAAAARLVVGASRSAPEPSQEPDLGSAQAALEAYANQGGRLVLHAGTPKTGTTALQRACHAQRADLAAQGFCYPATVQAERQPRHDWLVDALVRDDAELLAEPLSAAVAQASASGAMTLLLSTELLYNAWPEYYTHAGPLLRALVQAVPTSVWVVLRDPVAFATAAYQQVLRLDRVEGTPFGTAIGFDDFLELPWMRARLDYEAFISWWETVVSSPVQADLYDRDITELAESSLGLRVTSEVRANRSFGRRACELLVELNDLDLPADAREQVLIALHHAPWPRLDDAFLAPAQQDKVREMVRPSLSQLVGARPHLAPLLSAPLGSQGAVLP